MLAILNGMFRLEANRMNQELILTIIVAFSGWIIVHQFNSRRDANNKRKEIRLTYLMAAYRNLENASSRTKEEIEKGIGREFESSIADIQLFGTEKQVQMALAIIHKLSNENSDASVGSLLSNLRNELRKELGLKIISNEPVHFRVKKNG